MTQNNDKALHKIMAQVQVYASSYSLVGTMFASENQLEEADSEKLELYNMVKTALSQSTISQNEQQPKQIPDGWHLVSNSIDGDIAMTSLVAGQLICIRDALSKNDINEAYHLLYGIADPNYTRTEPWNRLEEIAMLNTAPTNTEVVE